MKPVETIPMLYQVKVLYYFCKSTDQLQPHSLRHSYYIITSSNTAADKYYYQECFSMQLCNYNLKKHRIINNYLYILEIPVVICIYITDRKKHIVLPYDSISYPY